MGLLGSWFVQLETKGSREANASIDDLQAKLRKEDQETKRYAETQKKAFKEVGDTVKYAFAAATASVVGFTKAGFSGTAEAGYFGFAVHQLSMEVASIFLPVMQEATEAVEGLTDWFRNLSAEQQDSAMKWGLWIGGIGLALAVLPKAISVIGSLITVFRSLGVALAFVRALAGDFATVIGALALAGAAGIGIAALTGGGGGGGGKAAGGHRMVTPGGGTISKDVTEQSHRIQQAALQMGMPKARDFQEEIANNTKDTAGFTKSTSEKVERLRPPVGP